MALTPVNLTPLAHLYIDDLYQCNHPKILKIFVYLSQKLKLEGAEQERKIREAEEEIRLCRNPFYLPKHVSSLSCRQKNVIKQFRKVSKINAFAQYIWDKSSIRSRGRGGDGVKSV